MTAPILGIGLVSAAGNNLDELRETLAGQRDPRIENDTVATSGGPVVLPVRRASAEGISQYIPRRALRRVDPFARMALLAAHEARADAGIEAWPDPERIGVVFGSGYGPLNATFAFQDSVIDDGDKCASPTCFANSVHNALASQVSIQMGIQGPCQTVTAFEMTAAGVFSVALSWLKQGDVDFVLAGMGDEYCPVAGYAYAHARATQDASGCDCDSSPGEGFVAFLLGRADAPAKHGAILEVLHDQLSVDERAPSLGTIIEPGAYAEFFGDMPTAAGFDLAAATLSLSPGADTGCRQSTANEDSALIVLGGES